MLLSNFEAVDPCTPYFSFEISPDSDISETAKIVLCSEFNPCAKKLLITPAKTSPVPPYANPGFGLFKIYFLWRFPINVNGPFNTIVTFQSFV